MYYVKDVKTKLEICTYIELKILFPTQGMFFLRLFFECYRNSRGLRSYQKWSRNSFKNLQYGQVHLCSFFNWPRGLWWSWFYNAKKIGKKRIYCWYLSFEILFILQTRHSAAFYQFFSILILIFFFLIWKTFLWVYFSL